MAKTVDMFPKPPKFKVRRHHRCKQCGDITAEGKQSETNAAQLEFAQVAA